MALDPKATTAAVLVSIFASLGTLFVAARLWTRFRIIRAPGWEDYVLILSWLCAVVTVVTIGLQVRFGLGNHANLLSEHDNEMLSLNMYISISTYCASLGLTKLAILMQYQRVFPTHKFQIWVFAFIAIIIGYTIATVVACIFVCWPVQRFWKPSVEGTCINTFASWFANAILNIVTDFMIILLPMPVIKRLKLARKQKWLLMGVFAFGAVVCIISIVRLHSLLIITHSTDPSYDNAPAATISIVEIYIALTCACLPGLRPLLAKYFSSLNSTSNRSDLPPGSSVVLGNLSHSGRKRGPMLPGALGSYGMQLNSLSSKRGVERLDGESVEEGFGEDKIRVVTRVDVRVSGKESAGARAKDGRESSTESLWRDGNDVV